jgi:HSP20 family protein
MEMMNKPYRNQGGYCRKPSANVAENDDNYKIELAAPGFQKKDFKILVEKDILTISTDREFTSDENYTMREFGFGNVNRSFQLPDTIDNDSIKAEYKNGILMLTLPKREDVKIKREIQVV